MENKFEGSFPQARLRRLRQNEALRRLVAETRLSLDQFVMPYFVREGRNRKEAIDAMPGQFRFSPDKLLSEAEELMEAGVFSILLFGIPEEKHAQGEGAWSENGVVQKTVRELKKQFGKDLLITTDVCLCAYTPHGHCGVLNSAGEIENDATLPLLSKMALSHAAAGADIIAPSDMMDGRVAAIRGSLDLHGFQNLPILSYAAKYASAFYGPFRDAAHSAPSAGDRKSYQMDPANIEEAMREIAQDLKEGADMVMVKPALSYLDVIREASRRFDVPLAAYNVSGEYSMIKAAAEKNWLDEKRAVYEVMTSLARAGANIFISYHTKDLALWNPGRRFLQVIENQ